MTTDAVRIPFLDLRQQLSSLRDELNEAMASVVASGRFVLGAEVSGFEAEFAKYCDVDHAVGVASGTDALILALKGLGIGAGDEVITVSHTFFATALAISTTGATPVFVDVDSEDLLMDTSAVNAAVTPRTSAVVAVHLYGRCADMAVLTDLARRHGLALIEDACQAHGARCDGRPAGSLGDVGCFSFYPSKNLGAMGDGGAIVTNDGALAERVTRLRNYGQSTQRYVHEELGYNSRLDELQAAILRIKLRHLDDWNGRRRRLAMQYWHALEPLPALTLIPPPYANDSIHLFVARSSKRDDLQDFLLRRGIQTQLHYPRPVHLQSAYTGHANQRLPVTEKAAREVVSLPMFPEMNSEAPQRVSATIAEFIVGN